MPSVCFLIIFTSGLWTRKIIADIVIDTWRPTQVVRDRSAKPSCGGSNPPGASQSCHPAGLFFKVRLALKVFCIPVGMLQTNCYILACEITKKAIIVDPGAEGEKIYSLLKKEALEAVMVVNTHAHYDHIGADRYFHDKGIPIAIHKLDSALFMSGGGAGIMGMKDIPNPAPDKFLEEGDTVEFGKEKLAVIFTPGHTPGHISLYSESDAKLFCGDTLFCRSIGRTDLPGGDYDTLMNSLIDKIQKLPPETKVFPGHGPATDIDSENRFNPWIMR